MNKVFFMGRIASDVELKTTPNGTAVCSFRLAVDRNYQKKGEEKVTDFFNIVAWRQQAEFISRFFKKGRMIIVEGEMQTRKYDDKNGNPATWYDVVVERAYFTGEKIGDPAPDASPAPSSYEAGTPAASEDNEDYPF